MGNKLTSENSPCPRADLTRDIPYEFQAARGFSVSFQGKTLLSRIDPIGQCERIAADLSVKERTLYFCPSPLYGYGLDLFLEKLPNNSAVLCVEANEKLFELSNKALARFLPLSGAVKEEKRQSWALARVTDAETLCAFVKKTWGERVFRRVEIIRLTGGWQLFARFYEELAETLRRELAVEWGNAMTMIRLGRLYARNLIRNLGLIPKSRDFRALNFYSSPVLVLGAGMSLDTFLDELEILSGGKFHLPEERRFRIICVDTCIPALIERAIKPDLVIILESQHWNLRDFTGAYGWQVDAALDFSALPASGRVLGAGLYLFATIWTELGIFRRLEKEGLLPETFVPMGSVGLSAVAAALSHGSGPVVVSGIDFSYTLDAYHARSTPGHGELERKQSRFKSMLNPGVVFREGSFPAVSKTGAMVRSDPAMRNYRDLFEQEFASSARLFDITGSGLPLGIKTLTPKEAFLVLDSQGAGTDSMPKESALPAGFKTEKLAAFVAREKETLAELKETLAGEKPASTERIEELLDYADYLWAHFPECAGTGGRRPPAADKSFLKRVRTEIDGFLECWKICLFE